MTPTSDRYQHGHAILAGRYWPTTPVTIDPPRRADGTIDIPALCRLYDDHMNGAIR